MDVPPDHWRIGIGYNALANVLFHQKRFADAEPAYRSAIEHHKLAPSEALYESQLYLALVLMKLHRLHEAESLLQRIPWNDIPRIGRTTLFVALYDALDQAEPGKGYDTKRQQWIDAIDDAFFLEPPATTQPAEK
jgi:tetratricopeptide (TPR) repeat protein